MDWIGSYSLGVMDVLDGRCIGGMVDGGRRRGCRRTGPTGEPIFPLIFHEELIKVLEQRLENIAMGRDSSYVFHTTQGLLRPHPSFLML